VRRRTTCAQINSRSWPRAVSAAPIRHRSGSVDATLQHRDTPEDSMTKRVLVGLTVIAAAFGTAPVPRPPMAMASDESPFRFELPQTGSHRGVAVAGHVYNALPWVITGVRLQIDRLGGNGTPTRSASGWVLGTVSAGGRGYF
jgi:hypothetical protein